MSGKAGKGIGKPSEKRRRSQAKTKAGQDEESKDKKNEMDEKDKPVVNFANRGKYGGNWDGTKKSDPEGLIQSYVLRVEEKNRLAESEWKKETHQIEEAKKAKALADEKAAKRKEEWDRTGFYRYQNAASKRIAQQRMDWFSQQQKENEKRLSLQHAQSAAPTRSSTGGMPRDAEAAGRCADWVQQLDEQPFVPARRRRYLKLEHSAEACGETILPVLVPKLD
ncbi:hypothetical protein GUITHDRAFT_104727 [Guillardia theta CCMP2712]|uniref:Uncharacterized protein n=1 Tax=Guillardia theta (strain CCMP2712) TaxID=905079 RepID=L1JMV4_GUITC|nr:hypothetical protein GUITHDRAFT_104727 [Guillardia theta CCMP2712]EKX49762.1 hypothetical protein GUITHDRAFT_104727 [Guillardia theta CCMP2712]|eukprot:XP_005836742.1 hypothetical protein GUITHDRAFT_104727 [Guillardia theta CCMP2712]